MDSPGGKKFILPEEYKKELRLSPFPFRDAVYNAILTLHAKRGKPWTTQGFFSDRMFWTALLDQLWPWIPSIVFIYLMYLVAGYTYDHYGLFRGVTVVAVMCIIRLNSLVRQVTYSNKLLEQQVGANAK